MAQLDARQTQCRRLDADITSKQQFESLTIYFGIKLAASKHTLPLNGMPLPLYGRQMAQTPRKW